MNLPGKPAAVRECWRFCTSHPREGVAHLRGEDPCANHSATAKTMSEQSCHPTALPTASATQDTFGRVVDYLRISITDRCNERCLYCMPEGYKGWERKPDHLTADEIIRVVQVAAGMGFRKFRLTGGEPLVRRDVPEIVRAMAAIRGVEHIGISTNGTKLAALAQPLRDAGVGTVNVSLDAR